MKVKAIFIIVILMYLLPKTSFGYITIDSITTTISTCPNNGSISIYAKTSNPPLLYSIIAGPVTQAVQTSNTFNSLPPGNYTIGLSNGAAEFVQQNVTVTGNYLPPDFSVADILPYCIGTSTGQLIDSVTPATGSAPFTWQLVAPSLVTTSPQVSDTFSNLPKGTYSIKLTDACNNFKILSSTIVDPVTQFSYAYGTPPVIEIIGCDSALVTNLIQMPSVRLPLTFRYQTKNGVYIPPPSATTIDSSNLSSGVISVAQIIPGVTYADTISIVVHNACGDSMVTIEYINPYTFYPFYTYGNCGTTVSVQFNHYTAGANTYAGLKTPVTYSLVDAATETIVDGGTLAGDPNHNYNKMVSSIPINVPLTVGKTYKLTITDGCGKVFTSSYTIPSLPSNLQINAFNLGSGSCLDSTVGAYAITYLNFSNGAKVILTSGPASLGSSKVGYAYTDTYTYPDTLPTSPDASPSLGVAYIKNLTVGEYQFKVVDNCGNEKDSFFDITSDMLTSMGNSDYYVKECGQNKIYYSYSSPGEMLITSIPGGNVISNISSNYDVGMSDSVLNVPAGQYRLTLLYFSGSQESPINNTYKSCWSIADTLTIPATTPPAINATTTTFIQCKTSINIILQPDSTAGIPPYQYEIISGPQTFPEQSSNVFAVNATGNYTFRIYDACGNTSVIQLTVDTLSFGTINAITNLCNGTSLFYIHSAYYSYKWIKPDPQIYTGDTLVINPVTPADTGIYFISRYTTINGCKDTLNTTYHLSLTNSYAETDTSICSGSFLQIGTKKYNTTGQYLDTLIGSKGCDSIIILNLTVNPCSNLTICKRDTITQSICSGQSITFNGKQIMQAGFYSDTIAIATCDSVITINLNVTPVPAIGITASAQQVNKGGMVQLTSTPASSYLWAPSSSLNYDNIQNPQATVYNSEWIYLVASNDPGNCSSLDSVYIFVTNIDSVPCSNSFIYMPNVFTPNADGLNDIFKIYSNNITLKDFQVFNRWGEMVFETKDIGKGWDGSYRGQIQAGGYVYRVSYLDCNSSVTKEKNGTVILIK